MRPTAQQVAARSGVSLRSIFRIFDDVETLHAAAATRQLWRVRHLFVDVAPIGSLDERVAAVVTINARLYEAVAPVRRAALRAAPESGPLRDQLQGVRRWLRAEIERVFAAELDADPSGDLADAVEALLSFEAWDQMRSSQGLSAARAGQVLRQAVRALLGSAPAPAETRGGSARATR